jgi:hypothetical protein
VYKRKSENAKKRRNEGWRDIRPTYSDRFGDILGLLGSRGSGEWLGLRPRERILRQCQRPCSGMLSLPCSPGAGGLGLFIAARMFRCLFGEISPSIIIAEGYARGLATDRGRQ